MLVGLVLLIPFGIFSAINAAATLKYEVEEAQIAVGLNAQISGEQKKAKASEISRKEENLMQMQTIYIGLSAAALIGVGVLLYNRKRFG